MALGPWYHFAVTWTHSHNAWGRIKGGSSHDPLPVGWGSQVGQTWLQPRPEALWRLFLGTCAPLKVTEMLKDTEWGIPGHLDALVPGPQDSEGWKWSADGPPFSTETIYWLYFDLTILTFNITGLTLVLRPLSADLDGHEVPLSAPSTFLTLSGAASPSHYCNPFPGIRSQRHALRSSWWGWKL